LDKLFKPLANHYSSSSKKPIFDSFVNFDSPSIQQRIDFVDHFLKKESSLNVSQIARSSNGLSLKQIASILDITALESDDRLAQIQSLCEKAKSTLSHRGEFVPEVPRACWSEIYGYQSLKDQLERLVLWPLEKPQVYARLGVTPPSGILLYGPIGCGKTSLVHGIASLSFANFISVKMYVLRYLIRLIAYILMLELKFLGNM
jgi:SpoVK/Ycf46/Vps4 family AAA+-type ATPase